MLDPGCGDLVAERFGLGERASLDGPVAFGRLGEIWRLVTDRGRYAVKHAQVAAPVEDAELDAAFHPSSTGSRTCWTGRTAAPAT